jgi:type IV secretory pathway VirB3-like protein
MNRVAAMNRAAVIVLVAIAVFVVSGILAVLLVPSLSGGSRIRMDDDATAFALCLYLWRRLVVSKRLVHSSAWKGNSANFA